MSDNQSFIGKAITASAAIEVARGIASDDKATRTAATQAAVVGTTVGTITKNPTLGAIATLATVSPSAAGFDDIDDDVLSRLSRFGVGIIAFSVSSITWYNLNYFALVVMLYLGLIHVRMSNARTEQQNLPTLYFFGVHLDTASRIQLAFIGMLFVLSLTLVVPR